MEKEKEEVLIVIYYLQKMVEIGFISQGPFTITEKGFDMAYDLVKDGTKMTKEKMEYILSLPQFKIPADQLKAFTALMYDMQEIGYEKILEKINKSEQGE